MSKKLKVFNTSDFNSGDGMLTTVWGPSMWHFLHTMSFNYPVEPTLEDKKNYMNFVKSLKHVLPCKYCRMNLRTNLKNLPITMECMASRHTFSMYIYNLHELVNKMLGKTSGLTFEQVRHLYENFRARCTIEKVRIAKTMKRREKGCTEPLYGKKAKGIIKIVPQDTKCKTLSVDEKCVKHR